MSEITEAGQIGLGIKLNKLDLKKEIADVAKEAANTVEDLGNDIGKSINHELKGLRSDIEHYTRSITNKTEAMTQSSVNNIGNIINKSLSKEMGTLKNEMVTMNTNLTDKIEKDNKKGYSRIGFSSGRSFKDALGSQLGSISGAMRMQGSEIGRGIGDSIKKAVGLTLGTIATGSFIKDALEKGSNLAEVQNVVDVTFESMSGKIDAWAKEAMDKYGLSETVAKKYTGTFGAMAKSFDFDNSTVVDMSESITALTADVASFYNLSTDESYTKLKSIFTGETESLKELGVVMTQTALDQYAINEGFGKTTKNMTEQEKVMLRYQFVTSRLSQAAGDFERTQDGWANQTRVLSLRYDALKASLGQSFIAILTPLIKQLNQLVATLQKGADALRDFTNAARGESAVSSVNKAISSSATEAADDISSIGTAAEESLKKVKNLGSYDELNVIGNNQSSGSSADSIADAISGITDGVSGSGVPIDTSNNVVSKYIAAIKKSWEESDFTFIGYTLAGKMADGLELIPWDVVKPNVNSAATSFATLLNGVFSNQKLFESSGKTIAETINTAWGAENSFVSKFNFTKFGNSLGIGINSTIKNIDWKTKLDSSSKWGKGAADALNSFLKETDFNGVGRTVGNYLLSQVNKSYEFLTNVDYEELGTSISDSVNGFFESMGEEDASGKTGWYKTGKSFTSLTKGIIKAFATAISNVKWKDVLKELDDAWWKLDIGDKAIIITALTWKWGGVGTVGRSLASWIGGSVATEEATYQGIGSKMGLYIGAGLMAAVAGWEIGNWTGRKIFGDNDDILGDGRSVYDMTFLEQMDYLANAFLEKINDGESHGSGGGSHFGPSDAYGQYYQDIQKSKKNKTATGYLEDALKLSTSDLQKLWRDQGLANYTAEQIKSLLLDREGNVYSFNDMISSSDVKKINQAYQGLNDSNKKTLNVVVGTDLNADKTVSDFTAWWIFNGDDAIKTIDVTLKAMGIDTGGTLKKVTDMLNKAKSKTTTLTGKGKDSGLGTLLNKFLKFGNKTSTVTGKGKDSGIGTLLNKYLKFGNKTISVGAKQDPKNPFSTIDTKIKELSKGREVKFTPVWNISEKDAKNSITVALNQSQKANPLTAHFSVPAFASGTYIKANTPQLAIIGDNKQEGEFVAPESKLMEMAKIAAGEAGGKEQIELLRQQNELLKLILNKKTGITKEEVYGAVRDKDREYTRINGHSAFV